MKLETETMINQDEIISAIRKGGRDERQQQEDSRYHEASCR